MVRENEIHTGNYFMVKHEGAMQICTVDKAPERPYFIVRTEDDGKRIVVKPEELYPIQLTAEWLRKLGYIPGEIVDHWIRKSDGIISVIKQTGEGIWGLIHSLPKTINKSCGYVHQLQNDYFLLYEKPLTLGEGVNGY